ncbi:methyltransferase domain-containing protein [Paraburkholderia sp. LEh10]|uniref:methyltransferase domain-containing protein n=1 Tax=Paraburkholderia sp. LEh10 TaxID=2821353 RepID=UPI001AE8A6B4|nr:class I SAM-dependent methyltransferase [Paraburkholderia sp. LEh10]MBP0590984.1 methyltransferase domain-containing protein [Paraburkholderia sp. LEh10]
MRDIPYEEQTIRSANPLARYAHRERLAKGLQLANLFSGHASVVIDFGTGQGEFLHRLGQMRPDVSLIGYEPYMSPIYPEVRYVESMQSVCDASVDVFTAFEVCEHLHAQELSQLMADAQRVMKPDGTFIISVPIMYGAAVVPKVLNWMIRHRKWQTEYTLFEVLKSAVGFKVARPSNPRVTHKGFDFRELISEVGQWFEIRQIEFSPVALLPWWLSSQCFLMCRQPAKAGLRKSTM